MSACVRAAVLYEQKRGGNVDVQQQVTTGQNE